MHVADTVEMRTTTEGNTQIGYITALAVTDRYVFVGDMQMSPHLAVLERDGLQIVGRFGPDGTARGSLREPSCIVPDQRDRDRVTIFDRNRSVVAEVDLRRPARGRLLAETALPSLPRSRLCAWRSGEEFLFHSYFPAYIGTADGSGSITDTLPVQPPYDDHVDLNTSVFAMNPSGTRFALSYEYAARIDLLTSDGEHYLTIRGPRPTNQLRYEIAWLPGASSDHALVSSRSETAYVDIAASDRRIYVVFSGCAGEDGCRYSGNEIQVFEWDGAYLGKFFLDRKVLRVSVSPDDRVIYGVYSKSPGGRNQSVGEWLIPESIR